MKKYHPPEQIVPTVSGKDSTFMNLPKIKNLNDEIDFLVTGIPWDFGVTNLDGARFGPEKIREISTSLRSYNTFHNLNVFEYLSGVDYSNIPSPRISRKDFKSFIKKTSKAYEKIAEREIVPFTIGGDHSITYPELKGLAKVHGPLALVHFDAHFDSIDEVAGNKYTHASFVTRALEEKLIDKNRSFQIGMRGPNFDRYESRGLGLGLISMEEFSEEGVESTVKRIKNRVGDSKCFVTFDIDGVDPAYAPGTGTPEPGGFTSRESIDLVRGLSGLEIIGADLVEVSPPLDVKNNITSYLASTLLFELISLKAVYERQKLGNTLK